MKKILFAIMIVVAFAGQVFAGSAAQVITSVGTSIGVQSFKPSNNVNIYISSEIPGYSAVAIHASGDRNFGTNSSEPKIFWTYKKDVSITTSSVTVTTSGTAPNLLVSASLPDFTGWVSL